MNNEAEWKPEMADGSWIRGKVILSNEDDASPRHRSDVHSGCTIEVGLGTVFTSEFEKKICIYAGFSRFFLLCFLCPGVPPCGGVNSHM